MNKAQTIYDFLSRFEESLNSGHEARIIFKNALNIDTTNRYEILRLRSKLAEYVYELADFIENQHGELKLGSSWSTAIIDLLSCSLELNNAQLQALAKELFPYGKLSLGLLVSLTNQTLIKHENVTKEQLEIIRDQADELIDSLLNSNLHSDVKSYMVKQLRKLIDGIDYYQIYGNEGLLEILEESLGHTLTNKNYQEYMKNEESNKWRVFLNDVSTTLATSESLLSIGMTLQKFIS